MSYTGYLRTKGASVKDHYIMQELERVKLYIRKLNTAEQVPTERIHPFQFLG